MGVLTKGKQTQEHRKSSYLFLYDAVQLGWVKYSHLKRWRWQ